MSYTNSPLASFHRWDILLPLARFAGEEILKIYHQYDHTIPHNNKDDLSPVTEADQLAHQCICKTLKHHFPTTPIISEEDVPSSLNDIRDQAFWLIDPLDGTQGFIRKQHDYTVNIALIHQNQPILGVVYAPALDLLYYGSTLTQSAFLVQQGQEDRIRVCTKPFQPLRVLASQNNLSLATQEWIQQLGAIELLRYSSSLKICRIAEGVADLYPRLAPTSLWDTAAAHAILRAAGGRIQNLQNQELEYHPNQEILNPHFVASAAGIQIYLN